MVFKVSLLYLQNIFCIVVMKNKIIIKSTDMFLNQGFKSVTMDDIAQELGISKKTIYQHFENKSVLVETVALHLFDTISCGIDLIMSQKHNPIEEMFIIKDFVLKNLKDEKTSPFFQLQKYYPEIHKSLMAKQYDRVRECISSNLTRGIAQGLYLATLNIDLISKFYFAGMTSLKYIELFDPAVYEPVLVQNTYLEYHLRAICSVEGIAVVEKIINEKQTT